MFKVFESLEELNEIVETAKSVPMTSSCIVPRALVLELLDDIKAAVPAEMESAQDVLDRKESIINQALAQAKEKITAAQIDSNNLTVNTEKETSKLIADTQNKISQDLEQATKRAEDIRVAAENKAAKLVEEAEQYAKKIVEEARTESERLINSGNEQYDKAISDALKEQKKLVAKTEIVSVAKSEAEKLVDNARLVSQNMKQDSDRYVDTKLGEFEKLLSEVLHSVTNGRKQINSTDLKSVDKILD